MSKDWPTYFNPDQEDPLAKAQHKYFETEKGKAARRRAQRPSVRKYLKSDKGKEALKKYYQEKVKPKREAIKACQEWLAQNPGKTAADYITHLAAPAVKSEKAEDAKEAGNE